MVMNFLSYSNSWLAFVTDIEKHIVMYVHLYDNVVNNIYRGFI